MTAFTFEQQRAMEELIVSIPLLLGTLELALLQIEEQQGHRGPVARQVTGCRRLLETPIDMARELERLFLGEEVAAD